MGEMLIWTVFSSVTSSAHSYICSCMV